MIVSKQETVVHAFNLNKPNLEINCGIQRLLTAEYAGYAEETEEKELLLRFPFRVIRDSHAGLSKNGRAFRWPPSYSPTS